MVRHVDPTHAPRISPLSPQSSVLASPRRPRRGNTYIRVIVYLAGFGAMLLLVWYRFLGPAMSAVPHASHDGRRKLAAVSALVMAMVLVYLLAGLILVFRVGRFFLPRPRPPRVRTPHIDIWAEAGKRVKLDDPPNPAPPNL
jgi:hypothetical protein